MSEPGGIAAKAAYVRRQGQTRSHECHWPGCAAQVPPAVWGCRHHWYLLPQAIRDRIWAAYAPGQEQRGDPSAEYLKAATDAVAFALRYTARHSRSAQQSLPL